MSRALYAMLTERRAILDASRKLQIIEHDFSIVVEGETFRYTFLRSNGLISQIEVCGDPFSSPSRPFLPDLYLSDAIEPRPQNYAARYEGKGACTIRSQEDAKIVIQSRGGYFSPDGKAFPMRYTINYEICFDGAIFIKVTHEAVSDGVLRWLCFSHATLNSAYCKYYWHLADQSTTEWTGAYTFKEIPSTRDPVHLFGGKFIPWFRFGNDRTAVEVSTESADSILSGWTDSGHYKTGDALGHAGESFVGESTVRGVSWEIFAIRNVYTVFHKGWKRTDTFTLAIAPPKRQNSCCIDLRVYWEGPHQFNPEYTYPSDEKIREIAAQGFKVMVGGANWRSGEYRIEDSSKEVKRVIDTCHRYGMKIVPYVSFVDLNHQTDAFREHGASWQIQPVTEFAYKTSLMCYGAKGWRSHWKTAINRVIKEFDFDGLYMDFWAGKLACLNEAHNCGGRYMRFNLNGLRDMMLYAYQEIKSNHPEHIIIANTNLLSASLFCSLIDVRLVGESHKIEETPLLELDGLYTSHRVGCQTLIWPDKMEQITDRSMGLSLAFQAPYVFSKHRTHAEQETLFKYWNSLRFFCTQRTTCYSGLAYPDLIQVQPKEVYASAYVNENLLVVVSNLSQQNKRTNIVLLQSAPFNIDEGARYIVYEPLSKMLLGGGLQTGNSLKRIQMAIPGYATRFLFITGASKAPRVLFAAGGDHIKEESWDEDQKTLCFVVGEGVDKEAEVTLYCPNHRPKNASSQGIALNIDWKGNYRLAILQASLGVPVEVEFLPSLS